MAPGPITAVAVGRGAHAPSAGPLVAVGHGIAEIPTMIAVTLGIGRLLDVPLVRPAISVAGAIVLVVMALGMFRSARRGPAEAGAPDRSPLAAGVLLSLGNPYFLVWWVTVGAALITRSLAFGLLGFAAFAAAHWLCDFLWCTFLSTLSFRGGRFFGGRLQLAVFAVCGVALLVFAGRLAWDAATSLAG
jgi:threonine/homoserine/homoserine lactone efflux protein